MSIINQSLMAAITGFQQNGNQIAVVVIDEQGAAPQPQTPAQQQVLNHVVGLAPALPVYFVELNPGGGPNVPTRSNASSQRARRNHYHETSSQCLCPQRESKLPPPITRSRNHDVGNDGLLVTTVRET